MFVYASTRCLALAIVVGAFTMVSVVFFASYVSIMFVITSLALILLSYGYEAKYRASHRRYKARRDRKKNYRI